MTEYELIDLIYSALTGAATVNVFIFTIICAYLVMAWLVGDKLTTAQVTMMNLLYLCTCPWRIPTSSCHRQLEESATKLLPAIVVNIQDLKFA